jgi:hypothetical protein
MNPVFRMVRTIAPAALVYLLWVVLAPSWIVAGEKLDVCGQVTGQQLAALSRKPLYPTPEENGCFWSQTPGGMAYLHIGLQESSIPLRDYFNKELSSATTLESITDLGDEGLMSVAEGSLGVIVIRKGNRVLQSAATFLDIEPGSDKQRVLWEIYRTLLDGK